MVYRFEIFRGVGGLFYWRYVAANNETMCHSEGFTTKQSAIHAIGVVKNMANISNINDLTVARV